MTKRPLPWFALGIRMFCVFGMIRRISYNRGFPVSSLLVQLSVCVRVVTCVDTVVNYSLPVVKQCGFLLAVPLGIGLLKWFVMIFFTKIWVVMYRNHAKVYHTLTMLYFLTNQPVNSGIIKDRKIDTANNSADNRRRFWVSFVHLSVLSRSSKWSFSKKLPYRRVLNISFIAAWATCSAHLDLTMYTGTVNVERKIGYGLCWVKKDAIGL